MDVLTGVSGCAPAWIFMLIEAMADGAVAEGMPRSQAYECAAQAVLGSAKLMLETGKHPGRVKGYGLLPGRLHDSGGTRFRGKRLPRRSNRCGHHCSGKVQKPVK